MAFYSSIRESASRNFFSDLLATQTRLGDHPGAAAEQEQRSGDRE